MKSSLGFIRAIIEVSHVGYSSYDLRRQQLVFSSELFQKILGYSPEEFSQLSDHFFEKVIHTDDREKVTQMLEHLQHAQEDEIITSLIRYHKANGEYIWVYSRRSIWERDAKGQSVKVASVSQDVTEIINIQEELRQSIQVLESISYKNAHQIRGPVATILGLTSLIDEKGFLDDCNREFFHHLQSTVKKLDEVIHEINHLVNEAADDATRALNQNTFKP